jgi:hypothetical protein
MLVIKNLNEMDQFLEKFLEKYQLPEERELDQIKSMKEMEEVKTPRGPYDFIDAGKNS